MSSKYPTSKRGKQVSEAEFRRLWTNPALTGRDVARLLGITDHAAINRAIARGLPRQGQKKAHQLQMIIRPDQEAEFRELWAAGVGYNDLAKHFGCNQVSIWRAARRLGFGPRKRGVPSTPLLAALMARSAKAESKAARALWRAEA